MRLKILTLAALAVLATPVMAHPDHDDGGEEVKVTPERAARMSVIRLISQAKLPASWSKATVVGTKERNKRGVQQTIVTFQNPAEKDKARQLLHVILNGDGELISAEHVLS